MPSNRKSFKTTRFFLWLCLMLLSVHSYGQNTYIYDFEWYSGATESWVYEAAPKLLIDVFDDPTTPENDVYFRVRNAIDTDLGTQSSIVELQVDTGTIMPGMFNSFEIWEQSPNNLFAELYPVCDLVTLFCFQGTANRIEWSGDHASGGLSGSGPLSAGVNPGEYITYRALLSPGISFEDVINAFNAGLVESYLDGPFSSWTIADKQNYNAQAPAGLRFAILVHGIVLNTYHPDGHGLFVTNALVAVDDGISPLITDLSASPDSLLDTQISQLSVSAHDPDHGPYPLTYQWTIVSGGGYLDDDTSPVPVYTPDDVFSTTEAILDVTVSDGENVTSKQVTLRVIDADAPLDVIVDNEDSNTAMTGSWRASSAPGYWQTNSVFSNSDATFRWYPTLSEGGEFEVYAWWTYHDKRASNVPYRISHANGIGTKLVDQNDPALGGRWVLLDTLNFNGAADEYIEVSSENGQAAADAVRLIKTGNSQPPIPNETPYIEGVYAIPDAIREDETSQLDVIAGDPDGYPGPLSYQWSVPAGAGSFDDAHSQSPVFTPPNVDTVQLITVSVEVSDGNLSTTASVDIEVSPVSGMALTEVIVDNGDTNTSSSGTWRISGAPNSWQSASVFSNSNGTYKWQPTLPEPGQYEVFAWWTYHTNRSNQVPYSIHHADGETTVLTNQNDADLGGRWNLLGSYNFTGDDSEFIQISSVNGQAAADAVRLVKTGDIVLPEPNTAPQITQLNASPDSILANEMSQLSVQAYDPDNYPGPLSIHWIVPPGAGSVDDAGIANPVYTPPNVSETRRFTLTAEVSDGNKTVRQSLEIKVSPVPGMALIEVIVDNGDTNTSSTGRWKISGAPNPWQSNSLFDNGGNTFNWQPHLPEAGLYEVFAWWTYHANRSANVPYRITHAGGTATMLVNQQDPTLAGQWISLGFYDFNGSASERVQVSSENGQACADAVKFVKQ